MPVWVHRQRLREADTVVIVPHHILHYFPFAALVQEQDRRPTGRLGMSSPRFLIDEPFNICYAPSLSVWDALRTRANQPLTRFNALGITDFDVAPSLPGVAREIAALKRVFPDNVGTIAMGNDASETRARRMLKRRGALLLATHGENVVHHPLSSYLMFQPDAVNGGQLTAGDVFLTTVGSDLIFLSACYSGVADRCPLPGDDLFGLQRAFLHSGARTVISGLWDVYDDTGAELVTLFINQLADGQPTPEALANAQRAFLDQSRRTEELRPFVHPYFWAVFTVTGDHRTRFLTVTSSKRETLSSERVSKFRYANPAACTTGTLPRCEYSNQP